MLNNPNAKDPEGCETCGCCGCTIYRGEFYYRLPLRGGGELLFCAHCRAGMEMGWLGE